MVIPLTNRHLNNNAGVKVYHFICVFLDQLILQVSVSQ